MGRDNIDRVSQLRLAFTNAVCFVRSLRRRRVRASFILLVFASLYLFVILPLSLRKAQRTELAAYDASIAHLPQPRVFIAAMLANCAPLLSKHWIPALLTLVDTLGHQNVFVSILENGSVDETKKLLEELEKKLKQQGVSSSIRFEDDFRDGKTFQKDGLLERLLGDQGTGDNWIETQAGWFPRRISYLAELRNMVLEPLRNTSRRYDKILFLNDVIFSSDDAIRLLKTNNGHYAAACGLDYFRPHLFYDTFAMRDIDGNPMIAIFYPFFPQGKTRRQLLAHSKNIEVKSCWNGMVSLNAAPFQNETSPLRFRAIPRSLSLQDGYLEGSEACLIHADMKAHWSHLPSVPGETYLNLLVRVAYTNSAYKSQNSATEIFMERVVGHFVAWAYDIREWLVQGRLARHAAERKEKVRKWTEMTGMEEVGEYCLLDQLQLLTPLGWEHV